MASSTNKSINLITCMKFFKTLINNSTDFIDEKSGKTLEGLKTVRTNYCQLLWMKSIISDLEVQVNDALVKYETTIEPLIKDITKDIEDTDYIRLYDMWDLRYHSNIKPPREIENSWSDMSDYDDVCRHIKAMKEHGYPNVNNILPLKELKSPTAEEAEKKFQFADEKAPKTKTEYYEYEVNNQLIRLPIVNYLDEISSCFYYYEGDRNHQAGVYISPFPGIIMQVPQVKVESYSSEFANFFSMKCKAGGFCKNIKCTYAHPGTDYTKIGSVSRCPRAHTFGNKKTLCDDIKSVNIEDVRIVSMYGLNDLFSAALWFSSKITKEVLIVLHDLEVCDNYTDKDFIQSDEIDI